MGNPAWVKGCPPPNPTGRPKGVGVDRPVRDLARVHTEEAIQVLVNILRDESARKDTRIAAAEALLNRGWGRPSQQVDVTSDSGLPLGAVINVLIASKDGAEHTPALEARTSVSKQGN